METPVYHRNPFSENVIFGSKLQAGDVLEENDVYASTDGKWGKCPCPGITLQKGFAAIFVRPQPNIQPR